MDSCQIPCYLCVLYVRFNSSCFTKDVFGFTSKKKKIPSNFAWLAAQFRSPLLSLYIALDRNGSDGWVLRFVEITDGMAGLVDDDGVKAKKMEKTLKITRALSEN